MDDQCASSSSCADQIADVLTGEEQRRSRTLLVRRLVTGGEERPVRDPDGRQVEDAAELEGETRAPRVVPTGGVHEQNVRLSPQGSDGVLEERPFP